MSRFKKTGHGDIVDKHRVLPGVHQRVGQLAVPSPRLTMTLDTFQLFEQFLSARDGFRRGCGRLGNFDGFPLGFL